MKGGREGGRCTYILEIFGNVAAFLKKLCFFLLKFNIIYIFWIVLIC